MFTNDGKPTEAEDLTQDVFIQVFRKLESFRGESAFTTWLHRLTVNQVLMAFAQESRQKRTVNGRWRIARRGNEAP